MTACVPFTSFTLASRRTLVPTPVRACVLLAGLWLAIPAASNLFAQDLPTFPVPPLPLPASPVAFGRLEERACTSQTATGQAIIACHHGLAGYSGGKSCLWAATYVAGKEQTDLTKELCVLTCTNGALVPDKCAKCEAVAEGYKDQIIWRTLGDLSKDDSDLLSALYGKLIPLVNANSQDETRRWLKQEILKTVLRKMIPLRHDVTAEVAGARANVENFDILDLFEDADPGKRPIEGFNPMGIRRDNQQLYVYESAFLERTSGPTVRYTMRHPDQLALDLLHELVHMTQEGSGYGDSRDAPSASMLEARIWLSELQVYTVTLSMSQVKVMHRYRESVPDDMPATVQRNFQVVWDELDAAEQRVLARWAWSLYDDWMRRRMFAAPASDGGVWGELCKANRGRGPCGMD